MPSGLPLKWEVSFLLIQADTDSLRGLTQTSDQLMKLLQIMLILLCLSNANIALGQNISFTFDDPSDPEKPNQSDISPRILAALNIANQ